MHLKVSSAVKYLLLLPSAASIAFFGASTAAMLEPVASNLGLSSALVAYPYAAGSVLFTLGARQYKRAALEGLRAVRRRHGKEQPACAWARVEVKGRVLHVPD